jgi:hypothetical protein
MLHKWPEVVATWGTPAYASRGACLPTSKGRKQGVARALEVGY